MGRKRIKCNALTLILLAVVASPAAAQKVYKCRAANGVASYQSLPCENAAEESVRNVDRPRRSDPSPEQVKREKAWEQLCQAQDRYINYVMSCVSRHQVAFNDMASVIRNPDSTEPQTAKATECYARWFKEVVDEVDAVMWRHCYYN